MFGGQYSMNKGRNTSTLLSDLNFDSLEHLVVKVQGIKEVVRDITINEDLFV